ADPAVDDLARLLEVGGRGGLAVHGVGGLERQPGAADQVQTEPRLQPVLPATLGAAGEEHQKVEDDEDEPEHGELPSGAHLSLRWCHGCPVSLYGRAAGAATANVGPGMSGRLLWRVDAADRHASWSRRGGVGGP